MCGNVTRARVYRVAALADNQRVTSIARLVTWVDIYEEDGSDPSRQSFSARHDAVLADGRRVVLLNDRGWSQWTLRFGDVSDTKVSPPEFPTRQEIEESAREVVGPDPPMPHDGYTPSESEVVEAHWRYLAHILESNGIEVDPGGLSALPHDVEFSDRVRARLDDSYQPLCGDQTPRLRQYP